ncbi:MAG TPA: hypothetical protein VGH27_30285 [Streptosporangiaceae bacterium]|jgi:hypothetical protein
MTFALDGESVTDAVALEMAEASADAAADWFLHPDLALWDPQQERVIDGEPPGQAYVSWGLGGLVRDEGS